MDNRHRVYYLASLHQNWYLDGRWRRGWDDCGILYEKNLKKLKNAVPSLKIRPRGFWNSPDEYWQMMLSCKKTDERLLVDTMRALQDVDWAKLDKWGDICCKYLWQDNH